MANAHDLLMAQRAAMMGKSGPTAKDYVQDGLIAMWDGIENAGWGVHDPNATVWKNLIDSRYDASLIRSGATGTFSDNALVCHGHTAAVGEIPIQNQGNENLYCECVFYFPKNMTRTDVGVIFVNATSQNYSTLKRKYAFNGMWYDYRSQYSRNFFTYANAYADAKNNSSAEFNKGTHHFAGSNIITIVDLEHCTISSGVESFSGSNTATFDNYGVELAFGGTKSNVLPCPEGTKIHSFRIYDNTLNDTNRMANYAIDKARFNLPLISV